MGSNPIVDKKASCISSNGGHPFRHCKSVARASRARARGERRFARASRSTTSPTALGFTSDSSPGSRRVRRLRVHRRHRRNSAGMRARIVDWLAWLGGPQTRRHLRMHSAVTAAPGVAHLVPSLAPAEHTSDTSISLSAQATVSVPVTTRSGAEGPGSPFGPGGPTGPGGPAAPCGPASPRRPAGPAGPCPPASPCGP
jgi:hypothetical protein